MASKRSFTLIELLISMALLAVVTMVIGYVFIANFKLFRDESSAIAITEINKIALDEITNQIRESQGIAVSCTPCGSDTTNANTLILQIWPLNASGEPFDGSGSFDYIVYKRDTVDNTQMRKIIYPDASSTRTATNDVLATDISILTFTYNNATPSLASEVTIRIKNSKTLAGKVQEVDRETKAVLRNK